MSARDAAKHLPVTPAGVGQNDRHENNRHVGHQVQRPLTRGRVHIVRLAFSMVLGRHDERGHRDTGSQNDAGQGQRGEQECPGTFIRFGRNDGQQRQHHARGQAPPTALAYC